MSMFTFFKPVVFVDWLLVDVDVEVELDVEDVVFFCVSQLKTPRDRIVVNKIGRIIV